MCVKNSQSSNCHHTINKVFLLQISPRLRNRKIGARRDVAKSFKLKLFPPRFTMPLNLSRITRKWKETAITVEIVMKVSWGERKNTIKQVRQCVACHLSEPGITILSTNAKCFAPKIRNILYDLDGCSSKTWGHGMK